VSVNGQLAVRSPADQLVERLEDPAVATALGQILDHADLLALMVSAFDGFLRRSDSIVEAVSDGVRELGSIGDRPAALAEVDLQQLASSLTTLSVRVAKATPGLTALLESSFTDPRTVSALEMVGSALVEGREEAAKNPSAPTGVFGVVRALKDEDVARGIGLLIHVARALGRKVR
jgi:Uncharacterized conserved protein